MDSLGCYRQLLQRDFELIPSEGYILMPTAFSPNGDGKNDIFKVEGPGLEQLIYLRIFTYTGTQIFETTNLNEGWDGTYQGKPQPSGVYFYKVKAKIFNDSKEYEKEGALKLVK
jgi:gliding motility-associated-like protein